MEWFHFSKNMIGKFYNKKPKNGPEGLWLGYGDSWISFIKLS